MREDRNGFYLCAARILAAMCVLAGWVAAPARAAAQPPPTLGMGIPDLCAGPTIASATDGPWSDPATWTPARVPAANDIVRISAGTSVTYDVVSDAPIRCLGIDGRLAFRADRNTRLTVGTTIVTMAGSLEVGRADAPIPGTVTAEIVVADQPVDVGADPEQFGTGLIGFGRVAMHGALKSPTFVRLASEPRAGDTTLQLAAPVTGWQAGDRLILPDTRHLKWNEVFAQYVPQWEALTVAAVSGTSVALAAPLQFDHPGARNGDGVLEFLPHAGNLSRSIVIRSANPAGTRGHTLFTMGADVDLRYVSFRDLGRTTIQLLDSTTFNPDGSVAHIGTNQIGRYPIHFHHLHGPSGRPEGTPQFVAVGNAVEASPKWAIAIHASHYGLVRENVMYDILGASLMTEDGSESFNVIERNFAVRGYGTGGREGGGREGAGFYFRGPNNYVRDNVAANFLSDGADAAYGFKYFLKYLGNIRVPKFPGADTSNDEQVVVVDGNYTPVLEFRDNEVYGATESGMTFWWIAWGLGFLNGPQPPAPIASSVIKNLRVWHVFNKGVFQYESNAVLIDGLTVRGRDAEASACCAMGFEGADYLADGIIVRNADIQGMSVGIRPSTANGRTTQTIEDSYLRNATNIAVGTLWTSGYRADRIAPRRLVIRRVTFARPAGATSYSAISLAFDGNPVRSLTQLDQVQVLDYNRVAGDSFRLFYREQRPDFVVPQTIPNQDGSPSLMAAPVAGLTNQQLWNQFGLAIAASVAPCADTRPDIVGFTCPGVWDTPAPSPPPPANPPPPSPTDFTSGDFDGDMRADITVYRPSTGTWFVLKSGSGFRQAGVFAWGVSTDVPVPGDYDGDRITDIAVYRPDDGHWFVLTSSSRFTALAFYAWGAPGDLPTPADYDGDGRTDVAIYRPSTGYWFVLTSGSGFTATQFYPWGVPGDLPVAADYDGDSRADIAVYRPSTGTWFVLKSTASYTAASVYLWGQPGDVPTAADYDGDGVTDLAVYRPSAGAWFILTSSSAFSIPQVYLWGTATDEPTPADFDGDGRTDIAVYRRSEGGWYVLTSSTGFGGAWVYFWGTSTDVPIRRLP